MESTQFNDQPYADDGIPAEEIRELIRQSLSARQDFADRRWGTYHDERASSELRPISRIVDPAIDIKPPKAEKRCDGLSLGFADVDRILGGLHNSEILTVAGLPSSGVSTLLQNIVRRVAVTSAYNATQHDCAAHKDRTSISSTMFCSLDTAKQQIARRFILAEAKFPRLPFGGRDTSADVRLAEAYTRLEIADIQVFDSYGASVKTVMSEAKSFLRWKSINLLVIDSIDSLEINGSGKRRPIAETMSDLHSAACELDVPIIVSCRIDSSRVDAATMRARFQNLSPAVQLYSDAVAILHRPDGWVPSEYVEDDYNRSLSGNPALQKGLEVLELEVVRQADGTRDSARLAFRESICRIDDIAWD